MTLVQAVEMQTTDHAAANSTSYRGPDVCFRCKQRGHWHAAANSTSYRGPDVCFRCKQRGHWARDCTKRWRGQWRPRSEEQSDVCFNCGQSGHWLQECPNEERGWSRGHGVPYGERRGHRGEHTHHEQSQTA
uniref:CCHC-type domain-containing protein n=1 Tax=Denticeps clupeoides TaxID=299321 RepID=A0AAY4CEI9_9TELE